MTRKRNRAVVIVVGMLGAGFVAAQAAIAALAPLGSNSTILNPFEPTLTPESVTSVQPIAPNDATVTPIKVVPRDPTPVSGDPVPVPDLLERPPVRDPFRPPTRSPFRP